MRKIASTTSACSWRWPEPARLPPGRVHVRGQPIVIGHRGAPGYRPEHTLGSLPARDRDGRRLHRAGLVSTKDHVLVARHENDITGRPTCRRTRSSPTARRPRSIDGADDRLVHRGLHARRAQDAARDERIPDMRPAQHGVQRRSTRSRRSRRSSTSRKRDGRRASTPRPSTRRTSTRSGSRSRSRCVDTLRANGLDRPNATVFIQSFEVSQPAGARRARPRCRSCSSSSATGRPYDFRPPATRGPTPTSRRRRGCGDRARTPTARPRQEPDRPARRAEPARWRRRRLIKDAHAPGWSCTRTRSAPRTTSWPPTSARATRRARVPARPRQPAGRAQAVLQARRRRLFADNADTAVAVRRKVFGRR